MTPRLKQLRLARGLSLEGLADAIGGIVSRQAIHQYEQGTSSPSPSVLNQLARALGTKAINLLTPPVYCVDFIAYRRRASMGVKEGESIQASMAVELERRADLQMRCCSEVPWDFPIHHFSVATSEEAELAAINLRKLWRLGVDPISDLTAVLEDHLIHVIDLKTSEKFDGLSGVVKAGDKIVAAGVACRHDVPGDRQRLSLAHELGHLALKVTSEISEKQVEEFAFRFGGAFLLPKECVFREIGTKRTSLKAAELILLKKRFKVSAQAIVRRLRDLEIISADTYKSSCILISKLGWRKEEPGAIPRETSEWVRQVALRGLAEQQLTQSDIERLTGLDLSDEETESSSSLVRKAQFRNLPLAEKRKLLSQQAEKLASLYEAPSDWDALEGDNFYES